jgi:hypothetical protein
VDQQRVVGWSTADGTLPMVGRRAQRRQIDSLATRSMQRLRLFGRSPRAVLLVTS